MSSTRTGEEPKYEPFEKCSGTALPGGGPYFDRGTLARELFRREVWGVKRAEFDPLARSLAEKIHSRGRDERTLEEVLECAKATCIEHAILRAIPGSVLGSDPLKDVDKLDPNSYNKDVILPMGQVLEVKAHKDKWFSFNERAMATTFSNWGSFDFMVTGKYWELEDRYLVQLQLVIEADLRTFKDQCEEAWPWIPKEKKAPGAATHYYNHFAGERAGCCSINSLAPELRSRG